MKHLTNTLCLAAILLIASSCSKDNNNGGDDLPTVFQDFATVFDGEGIGGIINLTFEAQLLINMDGTRYAWFEQDKVQKEWALQDPTGPFRNIEVTSIETGMILQWATNPANLFIVYGEGNNYMNCNIYGDPTAAGNWDNSGFYFDDFRGQQEVVPKWGANGTFDLPSIGACMRTNYIGCLDDLVIKSEEYILIDQEGSALAQYVVDGLVNRPSQDIGTITNVVGAGCPPDNHELPLSTVGAATIYDSSSTALYALYFSADGKSFCYYEEDSRVMSEVFSF